MTPGPVAMGLLALLAEDEASYGLRLRNEFERRTGGIWPLNVGQVYTTLGRLERDGLLREIAAAAEGQRLYQVTDAGYAALGEWFLRPAAPADPPARDELAMKVALAARSGIAEQVIQVERRAAVMRLERYGRLRSESATHPEPGRAGDELGWMFLVDSLMFQAEATVRWLEACEARLRVASPQPTRQLLDDDGRSAPTPPPEGEGDWSGRTVS